MTSTMIVVAVFHTPDIQGEAVAKQAGTKTRLSVTFTKLPPGKHGFHIHKAGDLRGEGCLGACEHLHIGDPMPHGGRPGSTAERHTGDLGNIELPSSHKDAHYSYLIPHLTVEDLLGRSLIVHEDEDDLGKGDFPDSKTTGHSGKRIGCAIFGRAMIPCSKKSGTRKAPKQKNP